MKLRNNSKNTIGLPNGIVLPAGEVGECADMDNAIVKAWLKRGVLAKVKAVPKAKAKARPKK